MSDARKGPPSSPAPTAATAGGKKAGALGTPKIKNNDEEATIKVASKKDKEGKDAKEPGSGAKSGIIKLKKPPPKHKQPGNWKEGTFVDQEKKKTAKNAGSAIPAPSPSPVVNQLDEAARETFATGRPLEDAMNLQTCKHCKKNILATVAKQHIAACLKVKKEKAQRKKEAKEARDRAREQQLRNEEEAARKDAGDKDDDSSDSDDGNDKKAGGGAAAGTPSGKGKKATAAAAKKAEAAAAAAAAASAGADGKGGAAANKKRKAEAEMEKAAPKKKKKEETKPKTAKPKGPVDVERQCGVILPNGQPCARSLTCKSHSMGAKRAVPGRSLPYDMLLAAYQKKNQAKQQKAAIDASAPVEEEEDVNGGNIDSDEEAATVMNAMANWRPRPVVQQQAFAPIKRQYQLARLFEQLNTATNGGRVNIFAVSGYGAQKLPPGHPGLADSEDAVGEPDVDMLTTMMPPAVPPSAAAAAGARATSTTPVPPPAVTSTTPIPIPATPSSSSPQMRNHSSPSANQRPVPVTGRA